MRRAVVSAGDGANAMRGVPPVRGGRLTTVSIGAAAALAVLFAAATLSFAPAARAQAAGAAPASASTGGMKALADDELSAVRGSDGIAFNLSHFSLTSSLTNPLTLTYRNPLGSSLSLSGLNLSRTDDADGFADPYYLTMQSRNGLPDMIALDFPLNIAGGQKWSLTSDFSNYDAASNTTFSGGTLQVSNLTMMGGGLYLAPSTIADTQGIAFGLGTRLDIGSLGIYSHGRGADGTIDTSDSLMFSGIHLSDAITGGAWMLADVTNHPGLINAVTDSSGSYLHLQIGWPTNSNPVPGGALAIDNITFTSPGVGGLAPTSVNLGSASIASIQLNYVDIKFKTGQ